MARTTLSRLKPPRTHRIRHLIFTFFYRFTYTILLLCLLGLAVITPGDHIYQTVSNSNLGNVFVVGSVYVGTALIALFIYASRLYTNRTALNAIPRSYLPIQKSEVGKKVRRIVEANWRRSALVAWEGRPRDVRGEVEVAARRRRETLKRTQMSEKHPLPLLSDTVRGHLSMEAIPPINPESPAWGHVAHPGWSSPSHPALPGLQFTTVIAELPNLLEAQAVSLAPSDPAFAFMSQEDVQAPPDPAAVATLQRQKWMGVREYLEHLSEMGLMQAGDDVDPEAAEEIMQKDIEDFLQRYEYARYSVEALSEAEFESLMTSFSRVLSRLVPAPQHSDARDTAHTLNHKPYNMAASPPRTSTLQSSPARSFSSVVQKPSLERSSRRSLASSTGSVIVHHAGDDLASPAG